MVFEVIYWILLLGWLLGFFVPDNLNTTGVRRAHGAIAFVLFAILGWKVFGDPSRH